MNAILMQSVSISITGRNLKKELHGANLDIPVVVEQAIKIRVLIDKTLPVNNCGKKIINFGILRT